MPETRSKMCGDVGGSLPNSTERVWADASSPSPEGPRGGQGHLDGRRSGGDVRVDHFRNWNSENFQDKRLRPRVQSPGLRNARVLLCCAGF